MTRFVLTLSLAALPFFITSPPVASVQASGCTNSLRTEPYVLFDVSGSTLGGTVQSSLVVYNTGIAKLSSSSSGIAGGTIQSSNTVQVGPPTALKFLRDLAEAGALTLCDQDIVVSDVPLRTLTVFNGLTDARTHTFSYWIAFDEHAAVDGVITDFIAAHF